MIFMVVTANFTSYCIYYFWGGDILMVTCKASVLCICTVAGYERGP